MITPETTIKLLNAPLDSGNANQIDFANRTAQYTFFNSRVLKTYNECTFQRKDSAMIVPDDIDSLWQVNYCMYRNDQFPGKWFYAYVTRQEYKNDNATVLYLETDVFQTWMFDYTILPSFVEREHEDENG